MTTQWITRETLLQKVRRQHDEAAWRDFVHYYGAYVYGIIRRMGANHHDAEEIRQAVTLKIWQKMPDFDYDATKGRFRGWVCTVTGNEVKMFMRKKLRLTPDLTDAQREEIRGCLHGVQQCPTETLAEEEWVSYITRLAWKEVRERFDAKTCEAFERVSRGETPETVAEALGVSKSSVYVYKKRVQDRLVEAIKRLNRELD